MDSTSLERAIRDCGLPGRLVELDKNLITLDLLNDRTERLERHELGLSEFCDLLLDWRQKLATRTIAATPQDGGSRGPRRRRPPTPAIAPRRADPDRSVESAA